MSQQHTAVEFDLDAGNLCLDFANTLDGRYDPVPNEQLRSYHDLVAFGRQSEIIDESEANRLIATAQQRPDDAQESLQRAIALRETFFRIATAIVGDDHARQKDLNAFNEVLAGVLPHLRVAQENGSFHRSWQTDPVNLDRVLWPVVLSALDLLTSDHLGRLRECAADDCGWLFLDTSRNQSRKWCSMTSCGNRAKVERFRKRESTSV